MARRPTKGEIRELMSRARQDLTDLKEALLDDKVPKATAYAKDLEEIGRTIRRLLQERYGTVPEGCEEDDEEEYDDEDDEEYDDEEEDEEYDDEDD